MELSGKQLESYAINASLYRGMRKPWTEGMVSSQRVRWLYSKYTQNRK